MTLSYAEQLRHPNWQRKRLECLSLAGWKCACCGAADENLHVHHRQYFKGRMAWEYESDELEVLCDPCHADAHDVLEQFREVISTLPTFGRFSISELVDLVQAWRVHPQPVYFDTHASCVGTIASLSAALLTTKQATSVVALLCSNDPADAELVRTAFAFLGSYRG